MHDTTLDHQTILEAKKQLVQAIIDGQYNLQSEEVLLISRHLDELMLPAFQTQLDFYNQYLNLSHSFMT
ncbi:MAG: aspartyl-phosphate phosphatase Spo0E family protein [Niameybacter sp.]